MKERIIAGLDIGTSKIVCLIAKCQSSSTHQLINSSTHQLINCQPSTDIELIGTGVTYEPASGGCVNNGVIVDLEKGASSVKNATHEAQKQAGVKLKELAVAIGTGLVKGENSKGIVAVSHPAQISQDDAKRAIEQAKTIIQNSELGTQIIHTAPQEFFIDDYPLKIPNPIGMPGNRLTANVFIITLPNLTVQNILSAVKQANLEVRSILPQSLAASYSVIEPDEQNSGCILIDIGKGVTDTAIFSDGGIRDIFSLELGSEYITNDISIGLKIPRHSAELLKTKYGFACSELTPDDTIKPSSLNSSSASGGLNPSSSPPYRNPAMAGHSLTHQPISRKFLASIIGSRIEEILATVHRKIKYTEYIDSLGSVVITGGIANIKGVDRLVERIFDLPARIGYPNTVHSTVPVGADSIRDSHSICDSHEPIFASSIGLLLYTASHNSSFISPKRACHPSSFSMGVSLKNHKTAKLISRLKSWFLE